MKCSCGFIVPPGSIACPMCGKEFRRANDVEVVEGEMIEVDGVVGKTGWAAPSLKDHVWAQCCRVALEHKKGDMTAAQTAARGYYKNLTKSWPPWNKPMVIADEKDYQLVEDLNRARRRFWVTQRYARKN